MDTSLRQKIIDIATQTIDIELSAINYLYAALNDDFIKAIQLILDCKGRVVVTGIGKSAIIGQKIVATLNSTGTPAIFLHAAEAIHGDIGMVQAEDIIIAISKSGNTPEIKALIPLLKRQKNPLIGIVANLKSTLGEQADCVLYTKIDREAGANNLAPTSSTTTQLVMGDALAMVLQELKQFSAKDFAFLHPGGMLGKKLLLKVKDVFVHNEVPRVKMTDNLRTVIMEISSKRLGATAVLSYEGNLVGLITDGDVRRMLEKYDDTKHLKAEDIMSKSPKTIEKNCLAVEATNMMNLHNISQLVVVSDEKYVGIIHLHDLVREGLI